MNPSDRTPPSRPDRRTAIKWMLTAAASTTVLGRVQLGGAESTSAAPAAALPAAKGYGTDPDMMRAYKPGDFWPLTFTDVQRATAAALCAVIIPADETSPSAADLGVHDFIDEWISAPYPNQQRDRPAIVEGLAWIDAESKRRFAKTFAELDAVSKAAICDDVCSVERAAPEFKKAARFFARFRDLTAGGFYTTPEGMRDIGYTGNVALGAFLGPPPEVLKRLGLA
jgi:hypothetical protein